MIIFTLVSFTHDTYYYLVLAVWIYPLAWLVVRFTEGRPSAAIPAPEQPPMQPA
jgi:hypothetical protein